MNFPAAHFPAANCSQFFLRIRTVPDDTFTLTRFSGSAQGLSEDFRFEICLHSDAELLPRTIIGRSATLELSWGPQPVYLHGVISRFERTGNTPDGVSYRAVLSSPLFPLSLNTSNRVFLGRDIGQLIEEVLIGAGYGKDEFHLELTGNYPQREFVVQYAESDFDFLRRQLARHGIFFTFENRVQGCRVVFCDDSTRRPMLPGIEQLKYRPQTGSVRTAETVFALSPQAQWLPGGVRLTDYNYRTPDTPLDVRLNATSDNAVGEQAIHGDHFKTAEEGEHMAQIRRQALDARRETFEAETDCRGIAPGFRLKISDHPEESFNGDYLVVSMEQSGHQEAALARGEEVKGPTYVNRLQLIKAQIPFRSPVPEHRQVLGLFTARVESDGTEYACLDEQGRYRIRTDFDRGEAPLAQASHPVRLMQPYGGEQHGMHFPLQGGTEVVLACLNGDLDRPVILGALSNPQTPNVVNAENVSQNIIRTVSGNELCMDDRRQKERIDLFTAERKNILTLDAQAGSHKVRLETREGDMEIHAGKTLLMESGESQFVESGGDHIVTVENSQQLMTRNKDISLQAATDIQFKAAQNIQFEAEKHDIALSAGENLILDVGQALSMQVRNDKMELAIARGGLSIQAAKDISLLGQGGGPITIRQGNGTIQISPSGDLIISAGKVTINGQSIHLKGNQISGN